MTMRALRSAEVALTPESVPSGVVRHLYGDGQASRGIRRTAAVPTTIRARRRLITDARTTIAPRATHTPELATAGIAASINALLPLGHTYTPRRTRPDTQTHRARRRYPIDTHEQPAPRRHCPVTQTGRARRTDNNAGGGRQRTANHHSVAVARSSYAGTGAVPTPINEPSRRPTLHNGATP